MINHVPIFFLMIGTVMFATSMKRKSSDLRVFASILFILTGVFTIIAMQTGEQAAEIVKALGEDTDTWITAHEEAAAWAQRSAIFVALLALAVEWAHRKKHKLVKVLQWLLLIFALHGSTVFLATALQGGPIRHSEVRDHQDSQ
jgi:surface polysaccharide O-acyltransferase-like enzyme